ncbi:hypothetical protein KGQ71_03230 [Patescibacteria group bacterium]|nr:hypothetical protein [Patescibacteria group bacterium]
MNKVRHRWAILLGGILVVAGLLLAYPPLASANPPAAASSSSTTSGTAPKTPASSTSSSASTGCNTSWVLINPPAGTCPKNFTEYMTVFINQLIPLIEFLALVMVVYSGIQYMISNTDKGKTAAKQRIIGILIGIAFFIVARLILDQIQAGIGY